MKKEWKKPELIVISRITPEESVLKACSGIRNNAANTVHANCTVGAEKCDICETPNAS